MSGPFYAVAVIHHGDEALTTRCLTTIDRLAPAPSARLVVWNGPGPSGPGARAWLARGLVTHLIEPGENLGYGAGANRAARVAAADGYEWMLLLNNDVEVEPTLVARLLEALVSQPDVALVGPRILQAGSGRIWHDGGRVHWPDARVVSPGHGDQPGPAGAPFEVEFVCGCAPLIRLPALQAMGGFDERFFLSYEDVDLGLRLGRAGWRQLHVPRAVAHHQGSAATQATGRAFTRYHRLRARLLCSRLHAPRPWAAAAARWVLVAHTLLRVPTLLLRRRGDEARALLRALRDGCMGRLQPAVRETYNPL